MTQLPPPPTPPRRRSGCASIALATSGFACLALGLVMIVFGIVYGYEEDHAFYQRQADYHALDEQRDSLREEFDSLSSLMFAAQEEGDTLLEARLATQLDSIESTPEYGDLLGIPEPPKGFSMAYLVTIIVCAIALLPLGLGISLLIYWHVRRKRE